MPVTHDRPRRSSSIAGARSRAASRILSNDAPRQPSREPLPQGATLCGVIVLRPRYRVAWTPVIGTSDG
jgi:hypothetical protein